MTVEDVEVGGESEYDVKTSEGTTGRCANW